MTERAPASPSQSPQQKFLIALQAAIEWNSKHPNPLSDKYVVVNRDYAEIAAVESDAYKNPAQLLEALKSHPDLWEKYDVVMIPGMSDLAAKLEEGTREALEQVLSDNRLAAPLYDRLREGISRKIEQMGAIKAVKPKAPPLSPPEEKKLMDIARNLGGNLFPRRKG